MKRVRLEDVAFDAGTQIRASISESVVADYAERMVDGTTFPPIVLFHDGSAYYLADGFHRFMAAQRNEFRDIDAEIHAGTKEDALWFALGANKANGQRLSEADKTHALRLAFQSWPDRSARSIAEQVGCSSTYASRIRDEVRTSLQPVSRVVGSDGVSYPASRDAARQARDEAAAMLKEGKTVADVRAKVGIGRDAVLQIRRDIGAGVDKSRAGVAQRRKDIRDMAERGFSTRQIAASIGVDEQTIAAAAKKEGIVIHADRVIGKTKRHDSTRIVETIVGDAENLTEGVDLIDFDSLPRESFARWIDSLEASRKSLSSFIARLKKEHTRGEAA